MLTSYTNHAPRCESAAYRAHGARESEAVMLILLSDGAGLTARQCATVLARAGHRVEALSPAGLCLCRMTRHVRRGGARPCPSPGPARPAGGGPRRRPPPPWRPAGP